MKYKVATDESSAAGNDDGFAHDVPPQILPHAK